MASEWDQFEVVNAGSVAEPAPEDWSQFETHKGPATHRDLVFQSLKDYGASPTAAAAIMGDIDQESGYKPRLSGDRNTSWGLLQVGTPMFRQFEADQARRGIAPGSQDYVYNQVPFILDRFKQQHPDRWEEMQNAPSSGDALRIFRGTKDWGYGIAGRRYQYAQNYEEALRGVPVEEVIKEVPIEKAIPVNVREVEVRRARPVNGQPPAPADDWSQFPEATAAVAQLKEQLTPEQQAATQTNVGFGPGVATPYPEGSPEELAMRRARPLPATAVPAESARGPTLEETVSGAIPQFEQFPQVEPPRRAEGPPTTVPEAYQEAGGGIGGVINALDFASKQPIVTEEHAKQIVSLAAGGARTAAQLTGHKDVEQGLEEQLSQTLSSFTTPEALAQIAVLKNPVARALFAGETLAKIPEDINAIARAYKSGDKKELGRAIAAASVNATMGASMAAEPLGIRPRGRAPTPAEVPAEVPAAAAPPVEAPPAAPVEPRGGAWKGIPFLSQDPIKAGLSEMGYSSEQIEGMTRSELRAIDWQAKTRGPGAPEPAGPPTVEPKELGPVPGEVAGPAPIEDWSQFEEVLPPKERPERPLTEEEKAQREHEAEMIRAGQEAIEAQGGMDLLEAVQREGHLPGIGHKWAEPYRGELKMLRETIRGTKGARYRDVFSSNPKGNPDELLNRLRARGFNIETPHELIQAVTDRIRTGAPHYGLSEAGTALYRPEEGPAPKKRAKLPGFENPIQSIEEVRADLERMGITPEEREILAGKHYVSAEPIDGAINEIFRSSQEGLNYMRTMASPGEVLIERGAGKPDRIVKRQPENLRVRQERLIEKMRQYFGRTDLTSADMEFYLRERGRTARIRRPQRKVPAGPEVAPQESALLSETQRAQEENAFAQQFFGKNYDELSAEELRTLHGARLHERLPGQATTRPAPPGGELFAPKEMPFTLRGEELTSEIGPEGATRAKAEAEAQAKREQGLLFRPGAQRQTLPRQITPTPKPPLRPGEPIAEADIRNYLSKALDIPVRSGMRVPGGMQRALGVYRVKPETIRTKLRNDIPTIAHEVGHYAHHLLFTDPSGGPSQFATAFDNELLPLGRPTSRASYPTDRVRMEGVAEFVREWLTDRSQAFAKAPNFTGFFESKLQNEFPHTWDIFQKARGDIARFIAQPGWEKARSRIVFDPREPRGTFRQWLSRKYTEWFNELAPIDRTMRRLTEFGLDPATAERVSQRAINYKGGWRGKADFDLEFDQTDINGNKVGKGLKAVLNGLDTKELGDFSTYVALKRAAEKASQGVRTGFEDDLRDPEVHKRMADLAPRYEQKRQALIKYSDNALQLLADSGFFTDQQMAQMRRANKDYVPFYRIYEGVKPAGPRGTAKSGGFVNTSSGVLRMKGSDRQIIDPLESIVKNTYAFRDLAERNRIGKEFVNAVEKTQGGGRVGESVMKPVKPSRVSHEEVTAHLERLGLDESDIKSLGPDIGMTLWRATNGIKPNEGVFRVWDKGKERLFQVDDPDLLKALSLSDSADASTWKWFPFFTQFATVTKMLRTGATLTPEFMTRNPFRDQVTAAVFSRHGFVPFFDGFRGMLSVLGKDQYYKDWVKSGGRYSGLYDIEGPTMRKTLERVIRDPGALEQAWLMLRHPIQTLGAASGAFEHATRVGEFRRAIDAGVDPMTAANASKDVTLNFSRAGIQGKTLNQLLAFFNAGLQDVDKLIRAHREAPVRTTTKAFLAISVPSIITWALGKDDPKIQNLPEWRKNFFWNLNVNGTVLSLPKPFMLGALYGTSVEKALDYANGRDPNAVRKALRAIYEVGSPVRGDMIAATNAFKPLLEHMTNYSFFQRRPLVSEAQRQLSPAMQFGPATSETAKFVGKVLNQSPIKIDNLFRGYFGGLGRYATDMTDWALLKAQGSDTPAPPAKAISQLPLIKGFVKQPYEASAYVQRFYNALNTAETRLNDMRAYGQQLDSPGMRQFLKSNRDQLAWYNAGRGEGTLMSELRKTRDDLSDINKAMVAVQQSRGISPEEKSKRLIKLGEMRDKLAEAAFKTYIHPSDRQKVF